MKGPQSFIKHCYILALKLVGKLMGIYYYTLKLTCKLHIVLSVKYYIIYPKVSVQSKQKFLVIVFN